MAAKIKSIEINERKSLKISSHGLISAFIFLNCAALFAQTEALDRLANSKDLGVSIEKNPKLTKKNLQPSALESGILKLKRAKTLKLSFKQTQKNAALMSTKESLGEISLMKPNLFRWETQSPSKHLLVSDGNKIWFYTPPFRANEKGLVVERSSSDPQSKLALGLLSGTLDVKKNFKIKQLTPYHFQLKPLKSLGDIEAVELSFEKPTNLLYRLTLLNLSGNRTDIEFEKIKLDHTLDKSSFHFVRPPNTEEMD